MSIQTMAADSVTQLQLLQQNLQSVLQQKQELEAELMELTSALSHLAGSKKSYRILGKIMVEAPAHEIITELTSRKEVVHIHLKNINAQEERLQQNIQTAQQKVMKHLHKE